VFTQDIEDLPEELRDAATDAKPKMQAPQRKTAAKAEDKPTSRVVGQVTEVSKGKSGEKNGKPWQVWKIKLSDQKIYGTFDEGHKTVADEAKRTGEQVAVDWNEGKYGRELVKIALVEKAPAPAAGGEEDNTPIPDESGANG
jgi:hypothetical protein